MTGRCRGTIVYQTCQPVYSQSYQAPPPQHTPTDTAVSEPSDSCRSTYSSIITFTVPDGHVTGMTVNGSWGNGTRIPSSGWQYLISPGSSSSSNFQNNAITYTRNGNQVTIGVRHGFTGTFTIGGRSISSQIAQTPPVLELQNPIQGPTTPPVITPHPVTAPPPPVTPPPTDAIGRILAGLRVTSRTPTSEQPYGGVIAFDAPVGTVSIRYESSSGNGAFGFTRNRCGGPLESNVSGVAYIQAAPIYTQTSSRCGSHLTHTQNHFGIGIDPNFRGRIIVSINGRERVLEYPTPSTPQTPPVLELQNPIQAPPRTTSPPTITTPSIDFALITALHIINNNPTTPPTVTPQNLNQAITNFRLLQNSFSSTERGVFWRHPTEERNLTRGEMRRVSLYLSNYGESIARVATQNTVSQEFTNFALAYRSVYNSHGL